MLMIFEDPQDTNIKTMICFKMTDNLIITDISYYEYNIFGEVIPPLEKIFLLKITSGNILFDKFMEYNKKTQFYLYILGQYNNIIPKNISLSSMKKFLVNQKVKRNLDFFLKCKLMNIYLIELENITVEIKNYISTYTVELLLKIKNSDIEY